MQGEHLDSRYFLNNHGHITEVSRAVWYFSYVHFYFSLILLLSALFLRWFSPWQSRQSGK